MFGMKTVKTNDFDEKIKAAKYECIYQSLKDILKIEIKRQGKEDKETIDYMATCSAIKTKARLAIDFVTDFDKYGDNKN